MLAQSFQLLVKFVNTVFMCHVGLLCDLFKQLSKGVSIKKTLHGISRGLTLFLWASSNLFSALVFRSGRLLLAAGEFLPLPPAGDSDLIRSSSWTGSLLSRSVSLSFSLFWDLDDFFFLTRLSVLARIDAVEWAKTILLDTTVCNAFEFQGSTRTMAVVRHDSFVKGTSGPICPTMGSVSTPGRRGYSPEVMYCEKVE